MGLLYSPPICWSYRSILLIELGQDNLRINTPQEMVIIDIEDMCGI
jgi:hypothetical protein